MRENSLTEESNFINTLKKRFESNMHRHKNISWGVVNKKLLNNRIALKSLDHMEKTKGEPDVVSFDEYTNDIVYCDCAKESPKGRRSLCYDNEALLSRKKFPPINSAISFAKELGITLLDEKMYKQLQSIESFDLKTSSWVMTPKEIRETGGAIFCDNRYGRVFTYHNGAESYYSSRAFRAYIVL